MLRELKSRAGQRWFSDADRELFVWLDAEQRITGFQLCYDKQSSERAVTWRVGGSVLEHHGIDTGDELPTRNDAPELTLIPDAPPMERLRHEFEEAGRGIDSAIFSLVLTVLSQHAAHNFTTACEPVRL